LLICFIHFSRFCYMDYVILCYIILQTLWHISLLFTYRSSNRSTELLFMKCVVTLNLIIVLMLLFTSLLTLNNQGRIDWSNLQVSVPLFVIFLLSWKALAINKYKQANWHLALIGNRHRDVLWPQAYTRAGLHSSRPTLEHRAYFHILNYNAVLQ